tara:strand:+ start:1975 stop:2916 length:942 start_codon:yes stop_codon:yes gene_type:complete
MNLKSYKFLVTGGAGFIGTNLIRRLVTEGAQVLVVDDFSSGFMSNIPSGVDLIEGDIADSAVWKSLPPVDYVFHLGAMVSVVESLENPIRCEQVNVHSVLYLLDYVRRHNVNKIVFASSAAVYGDSAEIQIESQYPAPKSPYGLSKLSGEYLLNMAWMNERIPYVALRMFNVFGPYQSIGSAYASVIPIFVNKALDGEVLSIFGDGGQTRDFIYVKQIVEYYLQALRTGITGVYNTGNNSSCSIMDLAQKILDIAGGSDSRFEFLQSRPGDIRKSLADITLLSRDFELQVVNFEEALRETVDFYFDGKRHKLN